MQMPRPTTHTSNLPTLAVQLQRIHAKSMKKAEESPGSRPNCGTPLFPPLTFNAQFRFKVIFPPLTCNAQFHFKVIFPPLYV